MDGESYVYKARVGNPTLEINDLPIGVYNLHLPKGKDQKYQPESHYLVVKQGKGIVDIYLDKKMSSSIVSQEIKLLGISNEIFATVIVYQAQGKLVIDVSKITPHPYWPQLTYSKIIIRDAKGKTSFIQDIQGTEVSLSHDKINFAFDDIIEIYHAEPNRLILNPTYLGILDNKLKTNVFSITKTGLKNLDLQNDSEQSLFVQITNAVTQSRGFPKAHHAEYSPFKADIYLAIKAISSPLSAGLMLEFQNCIPSKNEKLVSYIGKEFTISAKGINDFQFLTATLDLQKQTLMVKLASGIPHNRYPDIYASLVYQDTDANMLFL